MNTTIKERTPVPARQQHGFDYQDYVIEQLNLSPSENYISKDDAYVIEKEGIVYPVQIKFIKKDASIELGSYVRNKEKNKDFVLIIGFWEGIKGNIVEEYVLYPPFEWWRSLFIAPENFDEEMVRFLNDISNNYSDDDKWKIGCKKFIRQWKNYWKINNGKFEKQWQESYPDRLIIPRFKRDHKKQKRIQCAIPNKLFYKHFLRW